VHNEHTTPTLETDFLRSPAPRDYHAILRHEDEVGNEGGPARSLLPADSRWPSVVRVLCALAVAALFAPAIFLSLAATSQRIIFLLLINAATAIVAVYVGNRITRHEVQSWVKSLVHRAERLFTGDAAAPDSGRADFETYLEELARYLEITLEDRLQHERNAIIGAITSLVSALEARDPHTRNHSARVAQLAVRIGNSMGLSRSELYELHLGGILHDIGKIGIPDAILFKPGGLTTAEYETMKTHPVLGARILSGIPGLAAVAEIVLCHHEMVDGRGYPRGLAGDAIPLGARIVSACDTYLSMAEDRPYRQGRSLDKVMKEIRRVSGRQLDLRVVAALEDLLARETERFGRPLTGFNGPDSEDDASDESADSERAA
jgi:HD-GYP domain-containing protein (c-di-GMP phosphodiesterase class II)